MKKFLSLILAAMLLLSSCALADGEKFPLRSGVTFGMTMEMVLALEASAGLPLTVNMDFEKLEGTTTIAGQPDTVVHYYFENGGLMELYYQFPISQESYDAVEAGLVSKYGEAEFTSENQQSYHKTTREVLGAHSNLPTSNVVYMPSYSQRLIAEPDGSYVLIDHFINSMGTLHTLIYTAVTPKQGYFMINGTEAPAGGMTLTSTFTLHNGTTFGMNADQIKATEAKNGFTVETKNGGQSLEGRGTIAGQPDTRIVYCLDNGPLDEMWYGFPKTDASYRAIETMLTEKYGETKYNSDTGLTYVKVTRGTITGHPNIPTSNVEHMPNFSQRLIEDANGNYVFIDHFFNSVGHTLIYFSLTPEQAGIVMSTETMHNDL